MAKNVDIHRRIQSLHGYVGPWAGTVYRSCSVERSRQDDLLTGLGASNNGGRWNPRGIKALYASLTPETAMAEALSGAAYFGFGASALMPRVFVGMEVSLTKVLDLTIGAARQKLGVSLERMLAEDWCKVQCGGREALTQQIGRAATDTGIEAIIVVSAPDPKARNIVCFPDNIKSPNEIVICHADKLPK